MSLYACIPSEPISDEELANREEQEAEEWFLDRWFPQPEPLLGEDL